MKGKVTSDKRKPIRIVKLIQELFIIDGSASEKVDEML